MVVLWVLLSALILVGAVWSWRKTRQAYASEIFDGLTPGLLPAPGTDAARLPVVGGYKGQIAVAFASPKDVRPGLAGMLVFGAPRARDAVATIVDLAGRGFLTITIVEDSDARSGRDWVLRMTDPSPEVPTEPAEKELLDQLFVDGPEVRLSELSGAGNTAVQDHRDALSREFADRGWTRDIQYKPPLLWIWVGAGGLAVAGLAGQGFVPIIGGFLVFCAGAAAMGQTNQHPVLNAEGTAMRIQVLGFEQYLATAEKEQFSYEEAAGIFSKYLPYAISLGVAEHWTKVFADLAAQAQTDGYTGGFAVPWLNIDGWGIDGSGIDLADVSSFGDVDGGGPIDLGDALDVGSIDGFGGSDGGFGGDGGGGFDGGGGGGDGGGG